MLLYFTRLIMKASKRLAEMKSLWLAGDPVYSKNRQIELFCLFVSRWWYRLTEGLYFKLKYFLQRQIRGYDDLDKWNAAWYIARKSIPVLKAMRNSFVGTSLKWHREDRFGNIIELTKDEVYDTGEEPLSFTEDEWRQIIDDIIYAFQFVLDEDEPDLEYSEENYKKRHAKYKRGIKLFSIYYMNLWD